MCIYIYIYTTSLYAIENMCKVKTFRVALSYTSSFLVLGAFVSEVFTSGTLFSQVYLLGLKPSATNGKCIVYGG